MTIFVYLILNISKMDFPLQKILFYTNESYSNASKAGSYIGRHHSSHRILVELMHQFIVMTHMHGFRGGAGRAAAPSYKRLLRKTLK